MAVDPVALINGSAILQQAFADNFYLADYQVEDAGPTVAVHYPIADFLHGDSG